MKYICRGKREKNQGQKSTDSRLKRGLARSKDEQGRHFQNGGERTDCGGGGQGEGNDRKHEEVRKASHLKLLDIEVQS